MVSFLHAERSLSDWKSAVLMMRAGSSFKIHVAMIQFQLAHEYAAG